MSQAAKLTRARQLAGSVWPGRALDGYANLIVVRLRKLAAARSTGMLPFSGHGEGGIYFRGGRIVHAESSRTPGRPASGPAGPGLDGAEATVDAVLDLLSRESRYGKFRPAAAPVSGLAYGISLEALLTEVERRRRVLHQLAGVVSADTAVVPDPQMRWPRLQVSAPQWALLIRVRDGASPRDLAMALGRSVFGTTIEVYRLLALGLLSAPESPVQMTDGSEVVSFIRTVTGER